MAYKYLLFNDLYNGLLQFLYNWVGCHPLYNLTKQGIFHCSNSDPFLLRSGNDEPLHGSLDGKNTWVKHGKQRVTSVHQYCHIVSYHIGSYSCKTTQTYSNSVFCPTEYRCGKSTRNHLGRFRFRPKLCISCPSTNSTSNYVP